MEAELLCTVLGILTFLLVFSELIIFGSFLVLSYDSLTTRCRNGVSF